MTDKFISASCQGETCKCRSGKPATHKVEEVIFHDDPMPIRHPLTAYVCDDCFNAIMIWDAAPLSGIRRSRYHWQFTEASSTWTLLDEQNEYVAGVGLLQNLNVQFVNDSPDIEEVLLVADKIKELLAEIAEKIK